MKISKQDIQSINRKRSARTGKIYSSFEGNSYIGQKDGTLVPHTKSHKQKKEENDLEKRVATNEKDIDTLEDTKDDIVDVDKKIADSECLAIAMTIALG